jgi:hypothetical protein
VTPEQIANSALEAASAGATVVHCHVRDPKIHPTFSGRAASVCTTCHDHENSPSFAYAAYWPRIRHGDEKPTAGK